MSPPLPDSPSPLLSSPPLPDSPSPLLSTGTIRNGRFLRNVRIPLRDGVETAATIFFPQNEGRYPVIVVRTAYNRLTWFHGWQQWIADGFIFISQDVRGRHDSDGVFDPFLQESRDTPDTIAWIKQQPWCDGRVGITGPSYLGWAQMLSVANDEGPHPDALLPSFMTGDAYERGFYNGGALSLFLSFWWACFDVGSRINNSSVLELFDIDELCRRLPLETLDESCGAGVVKLWREFMAHPTRDEFWKQFSIREGYDRFTMPTLQMCGWYDYYPNETIHNWNQLVAHARTPEIAANHKLLIGPWGHHHDLSVTEDGHRAIDFGPESGFDAPSIYRAWFTHLFKSTRAESSPPLPPRERAGVRVETSDQPTTHNTEKSRAVPGPSAPPPSSLFPLPSSSPIRIFIMGKNYWRDENEWPLARTKYVNFYLHSKGSANTLHGDGTLSPQPPASAEPPDQFTYDPANPMPTRGGNHSIGPWNEFYKNLIWCGPCDQRPNEQRPDMLIYTTPPLESDLEVTGPIKLKLFATTDVPDTDFVARLCDVYPDGRSINITEGMIRARFRAGDWARPELIQPGATLEYTLDLQSTSNVFLKGHRIRLQITSSNFPLWDRNLNTGEHPNRSTRMQIARQKIHHESKWASCLVLPVIE